MAEFIIADSNREVIEILADSMERALEKGVERLLISDYDKKYGNVYGVEKPNSEYEWKELENKLTISAGEFYEYFGHSTCGSAIILKYVREQLDTL